MQKDELEHILKELDTHVTAAPLKKMAGGSVANTVRGLSVGFGVATGIIGAYGDDEQGQLFVSNMGFSGVSISRLRKKKGSTGQVCFFCLTGELFFFFFFFIWKELVLIFLNWFLFII